MDIDRQAIERRDFPIGRRGYDPAAVDAHLRALAAEFEELQRASAGAGAEPSLASTAATQVQSILTAAETAAADIERQALREREGDPRAGRQRRRAHARGGPRAGARTRGGRRAGDRGAARARLHDGRRGRRAGGEPAYRRRAPGGRSGGGSDEHGRALRRRLRTRRRQRRGRRRGGACDAGRRHDRRSGAGRCGVRRRRSDPSARSRLVGLRTARARAPRAPRAPSPRPPSPRAPSRRRRRATATSTAPAWSR